ncbi:hypothetical protein ACOMHN_005195 [Nucella lapillus]
MKGGVHYPLVSGREVHPFDKSTLKPTTMKNGTLKSRVHSETRRPFSEALTVEEHKSRVKSETRYHSSQMLTEDEKQSAKCRRSSFPPLPKSRDHSVKKTIKKSRHSMSEVVARMRFREKTLMGEALVKEKKTSDTVRKNNPPMNGFMPAIHTERAAPQKIPPRSSAETSDPNKSPRTIRTRKHGTVMPLNAWTTPREPAEDSFGIRGTPVFSKNVQLEKPALVNGQSPTGQNYAFVVGQEHMLVTGQNGGEQPEHQQSDRTEDAEQDLGDALTAAGDGDDGDDDDFDFDQGEDEVEAQRLAKRQCVTTPAVYQRACERLKIQPAPAFLRQCDVTAVDLCDVGLGPADVKPIAIALVRDTRICSLDLSNNDLGPLGVSYIAEMLQENRTLYDLNLSGTNPGREGVKALSETLPHNRHLLYLRLEENGIQHTEAPLLAHIIQSVPTLQGLYLGHNKLGYHGGASLASAITQNNSLLILDLQWNHIRRDSGVALVRALAKNNRLRQLNLAWNGLGKEGCLALAHVLPANTALQELDLTCNRVDLLSLGFLLKGLSENSRLTSLKIGQNPITTEGARALLETVNASEKVALTEIDITGVPVDLEFTQLLSQVQKTRLLHVKHEEAITLATSDRTRDHDGTNLDRYDPVMVFFEYMKMDNLRVIDMFQFMDTKKRDKLSKGNIRDGLNTLRVPVTEDAIDVIHQKLDLNRDGFVELDEMMKVQRDTARQVKIRQIKAKAKNREDESLKSLHKILREVISKRTQENESRRESQAQLNASRRRSSSIGGGRRTSVGGLQVAQSRFSLKSTRATSQDRQVLQAIPDDG